MKNCKSKLCKSCGNKYKPRGSNQKYCNKCIYVEVICKKCGKLFKIKRSKYNLGKGKVCSIKCVYSEQYFKEYWKNYRQREVVKEEKKLFMQNYRAKKKYNGGNFSLKEWNYIKWLYNYRCATCQKKIKLTIDHIIPVSRKGQHVFNNIQPLCLRCNCVKQNYDNL